MINTVVAEFQGPEGDYVIYGDGTQAPCCFLDLRTPVLNLLRQWIWQQLQAQQSKKQISHRLGLPMSGLANLLSRYPTLPTATMYELAHDLGLVIEPHLFYDQFID